MLAVDLGTTSIYGTLCSIMYIDVLTSQLGPPSGHKDDLSKIFFYVTYRIRLQVTIDKQIFFLKKKFFSPSGVQLWEYRLWENNKERLTAVQQNLKFSWSYCLMAWHLIYSLLLKKILFCFSCFRNQIEGYRTILFSLAKDNNNNNKILKRF